MKSIKLSDGDLSVEVLEMGQHDVIRIAKDAGQHDGISYISLRKDEWDVVCKLAAAGLETINTTR